MPRPQGRRQFSLGRKKCNFCRKKILYIDFKDSGLLSKYLTNWGKLKSGRDTGTCSRHQRMLTDAIKRARFMAVLPYVKR